MDWISKPKDDNFNGIEPNDACGIHGCFIRKEDPGSCAIRFCLTRYCIIDY